MDVNRVESKGKNKGKGKTKDKSKSDNTGVKGKSKVKGKFSSGIGKGKGKPSNQPDKTNTCLYCGKKNTDTHKAIPAGDRSNTAPCGNQGSPQPESPRSQGAHRKV